jgi:hypothetical protein
VRELPVAPTFNQCVEALRRELLRARTVVGCRWASPRRTPSLSGSERYELGLLLDALHDIPAYLSALASGEPELVLVNIVERALGDTATTAVAPAGATDPAAFARRAQHDVDEGPFGPVHET